MDVFSLYDQCASIIAETLKLKNYKDISEYLSLFNNRIPITIHERVYFHIIRLRARCNIPHQRILNKLYNSRISFPSHYIRYHTHNGLDKIFPQHNVTKQTFKFLDATDGCFINFNSMPNLMDDIIYKYVDINLEIGHLIRIIRSHIDLIDIKHTILAGGIFSNYPVTDPFFDNKFEIFQYLKRESDCDIYIQDGNMSNFNKYLKKFTTDHANKPFAINNSNYKLNSFKLRTIDGLLLNFIFPSNGHSILRLVENFDLDICQIFYSFALDSLYFPISLFKIFHDFLKKLPITNIELASYLTKNLEIFFDDLKKYTDMCINIKREYGHLTKIGFLNEVSLSFDNLHTNEDSIIQIWLLRWFINGRFQRLLKYFYKRFILKDQIEILKSPINFLLEIFDPYLIAHKYYSTKDILTRTRSRNDTLHYLLENQFAEKELKKVFIECLYSYATN
jgi:hypothetical protein